MIQGVRTKVLKANADERGYLMELLRADEAIFEKFGQCYVALNYPGVIRAWHYHKLQSDFWAVVSGAIKAVLYDMRDGSATKGVVEEYFLGDHSDIMLSIPPCVLHGYKTIGVEPSLLLNFPTEPYNHDAPDEYRLPWDSPEVPYDWAIRMR